MPVSHLASLRHRVIVGTLVGLLVVALAGAAVAMTVPAASSTPTRVASAPQPDDVAVAVSAAADEALAHVLAEVRSQRTLFVFGDSISARFNDELYHPEEAWWSILQRKLPGVRARVRAEGGSGFVNPGLVGCAGHTFGEQLAAPLVSDAVADAGVVVIEGGRTDTQTCRKGGGYELVPEEQLYAETDAFMAQVAALRARDACTLVMVPWGPAGLTENRDRVTALVRDAAARHGFTFVDTSGLLTWDTVIEDGVHPNRVGNEALVRAVMKQGRVRACFR